jgi:hypothetical protein
MEDKMIRTGDLVVPDNKGFDILKGVNVFPYWGSKERGMPKSFGIWKLGDVGVVLESLENQVEMVVRCCWVMVEGFG